MNDFIVSLLTKILKFEYRISYHRTYENCEEAVHCKLVWFPYWFKLPDWSSNDAIHGHKLIVKEFIDKFKKRKYKYVK